MNIIAIIINNNHDKWFPSALNSETKEKKIKEIYFI